MKRRGFLKTLAGLAGVAVAPAVSAIKMPISEFSKDGALRVAVAANLSETSLEEALVAIMRFRNERGLLESPARFALVVSEFQNLYAVRMIDEINRLRSNGCLASVHVPLIELRVDSSMTDCYEWGLVADNGRCFYSPGCR